MATTDAHGHGGLALAGSATLEFEPGVGQVDSDLVVEWDFGLGFEAVTSYLYEAESFTGRDWPSQLQGKAGPGRLSMRLDNRDDRFSYFNSSSPLNQGGRSLDPGRRIRVRTSDATDVDPVLLARDRFDGTGALTTDELGTAWEHQTVAAFTRLGGQVVAPASGSPSEVVLDVGAADYYAQVTVAELGDNVNEVVSLQELDTFRLIYRWQDSSNYSYLSYGPFNGGNVHFIQGFNVVTGTPFSVYGPFSDVFSGATDSHGDHRRRVTLGVQVEGATASYYVNGVLHGTATAVQTDETHVGLHAYYGLRNRAPAVDEFAVWDRFPSSTEGVLWTGHVVDVFPEAVPGAPKTVTVTAEGTLAQLAQADVRPQAWAGRLATGIALGEAVQRAGLLYPPGELSNGNIAAGSSSDAEVNALAHCRKLEEVEAGFLHEAPEGWLVFRSRSYRDALTVQATFSDAPGAQFGYESFELLQWRRELVNKVTAGVSQGGPDLVSISGQKAGTASGVARTIDFTFPGSVQDGDLFVLIIASTIADDNENWPVPIFWVRERDTGATSSRRTQVYTHIAAAADASTVVGMYNDSAAAGGSFVWFAYQIRNWYGTHEGIHVGAWTGDPGNGGFDPEAVLPPWGDTNPTLFVAQQSGVGFVGAGAVTNPTYPLGYVSTNSDFQNGSGSNVHDCALQVGHKIAMTALEDPSAFSGMTSLFTETSVVAVRGRNGSPPEPRGRNRVTVEDVESQRKHGVVASYEGTDLFPDEDTAETWCELVLTRYAQLRPIVRLTFTATASGTYRALAARLRLSDKVRLVANGDTGMGIDGDFHVESLRHRVTSGGKLWKVTVELSPA